jgi:hypothetical protein
MTAQAQAHDVDDVHQPDQLPVEPPHVMLRQQYDQSVRPTA